MRKKRLKALFSELVGRAGLIRPPASPCGQRWRVVVSLRSARTSSWFAYITDFLLSTETKKAPKGAFL